MDIKEVKKIYSVRKNDIENRLNEFEQIWNKNNNKELFREFVFCLLTPQSKAKTCWKAVLRLIEQETLFNGDVENIREKINDIRFKNKKAVYICLARDFFSEKGSIIIGNKLKSFSDRFELRDWLVKNIKGMGYKEASHFLRNIGLGEGMTILDRHILKNLKLLKVIRDIPEHLSEKRYFEIEDKMQKFSKKIKIPVHHLDFVLWSKETGEIFK
jgi:N-glycosylase/DNA lyase